VVRDARGEHVCFLSGQRAVIGDEVRWVEAQGGGGKLVEVLPRERALVRVDFKGREQVVASHLGGLLSVISAQHPAYRSGLLDRYHLAALQSDVRYAVVLTKIDLGVPEEVEADLAWRVSTGVDVLRVSATEGTGIAELYDYLQAHGDEGPWAFVGHSGVGKTSVTQALLPDEDVGPVAEISAFWGTGQHTTTGSRIYAVGDAEIADSPGIRTFLPSGLSPLLVRQLFPGMATLACRYHNCLHRPGEDGCVAEEEVDEHLVTRYRRLLDEVTQLGERTRSAR
jgi:ribosome biogenesis GTPase